MREQSSNLDNEPRNPLVEFLFFVLITVMGIVITCIMGSCATVQDSEEVIHKEKDSLSLVTENDSISDTEEREVTQVVDLTDRHDAVTDSVSVSDITKEVTTIYVDTTGKEIGRCTSVYHDRVTDHWRNAVTSSETNHYEVDSLTSLVNIQSRRLKDLEHSQSVVDSLKKVKTVDKATEPDWRGSLVQWALLLIVIAILYIYITRKRK